MGLLSHEKNFGIYAGVYIKQLEAVLSMEIVPREWVPRVVDGSSLHIKRAVAFAPTFQFFDPVSQHGCDLPICIKCSYTMNVAKRWRLDRFCHVIDYFYPKLFLSRGFECSSPQCRCEILATNPVYSSMLPQNIQILIPQKNKRSMVSRKLVDEISQDLYRFNKADQYIKMISDQQRQEY